MEENTNLKVTNSRWYPKYHIAAPAGWVNDPNGFSFFKGKCHFFYQHYPYGVEWGPMHWGHVVSEDLIHWEHLPIALAPDKDFDNDGVFSGSGIEADGKLYLIYTGNILVAEGQHFQKQCLAWSDDGIHFTKSKKNPIIDVPENVDMSQGDFRDPKVWEHDGKYYALLGAKTADGAKGQVLLYESKDLENWTFKNISARAEGNQGKMWECPNFAEVSGQDLLILSPMEIAPNGTKFLNNVDVVYFVGEMDYSTGIFNHGAMGIVDHGFDFYAPQVTNTPDGRTILIGWLDMWFMPQPEQADGWAGQMTIPRELKIKNNKLYSTPIKELEKLREHKIILKDLSIDKATSFDGISGAAVELCLTVDAKDNFSITIRNTFRIAYDNSGIIKINRDAAFDERLAGERETAISPHKNLKLRIFIDRSSVEVFVNDGEAVFSARIYPEETATGIEFVPQEKLNISELKFYTLGEGIPQPEI